MWSHAAPSQHLSVMASRALGRHSESETMGLSGSRCMTNMTRKLRPQRQPKKPPLPGATLEDKDAEIKPFLPK